VELLSKEFKITYKKTKKPLISINIFSPEPPIVFGTSKMFN
jgi:hypothetical protein